MIYLKTPEEIEIIRVGGQKLSKILGELVRMVKPGVTTEDLDSYAERRMIEEGGEPSFKGYHTGGERVAFPSSVCTSINHEVVHAPAIPAREYKEGDLVKLDIGMWYEGLCTDMAVTVPCGAISNDAQTLIEVTRESLVQGVDKCVEGGWIVDIGKAVDKYVRRNRCTTVKALTGHGVGKHVHEDPPIPNYVDSGADPVRIARGMVLAIEPMVNAGDEDVRVLRDGWTIVTSDKSLSAHFEVTLAITEKGTEIMTPLPV